MTSGPSPHSPSREFRFTSEVPIWLDYHGKHVTMDQVVSGLSGPRPAVALGGQGAGNTGCCQPLEAPGGWASPWAPGCKLQLLSPPQGTFAGLLIGLAQLNCSELKLKRLCCRHG